MKTSFQRFPPKIRHYKDYCNFGNNMFRVSLFNELLKLNIEIIDLNPNTAGGGGEGRESL